MGKLSEGTMYMEGIDLRNTIPGFKRIYMNGVVDRFEEKSDELFKLLLVVVNGIENNFSYCLQSFDIYIFNIIFKRMPIRVKA